MTQPLQCPVSCSLDIGNLCSAVDKVQDSIVLFHCHCVLIAAAMYLVVGCIGLRLGGSALAMQFNPAAVAVADDVSGVS